MDDGAPRRDGSASFRVVALISSFNEGDVISAVIGHLVENGVDVYLLDNHSTDDTVEQARGWLGRGLLEIEMFPAPGDVRYATAADRYDWTAILRRKEELARTLEADWFLHHDADEIRESPWPGLTLNQAIRVVDTLDFNCIDFRVFECPPLDDGFRQGMDPRTYFTHYREAQDYDQLQLKGWKSRASALSLLHYGGHDVTFEGRRIFPIQFLLRHYPIRGQEHGRRKVFTERRPRFSTEERAKSWHRQYDHVEDESHSFLADPEFLRPFDLLQAQFGVQLRNREVQANLAELRAQIARCEQESATQIGSLEAKRADLDEQLRQVRRQQTDLESSLRQSREELSAVYASRTWRWGEPIGRFIGSLGFKRKKS